MKQIIKKVLEQRNITLFFAVIIIMTGLYSYYLLPRQENPDISVPVAMVVTPYPGASAEDVHDLVTKVIEDKVAEIDGYDYSQGVSKENVSIVTIFFHSDADYNTAMQDVRNAVTDARDELPQGTSASNVNTNLVESAGMIISVSGEDYTYDQLESFGETFRKELQKIDGISKTKLIGKLDKEVAVDVNIAKLNQLPLSLEDVCKILASQNVQIPSGNINYPSGKITVFTPGNYSSVEDIKNTIISVSSASGIVTRINDIAEVQMQTEEGSQKIKVNGQKAVLLTVYFNDNQNIVNIGKDVRRALDRIKADLPPDLVVNEVIYQPDSVSESTNQFMLHLVFGIILVIAAVFFAMGIRNALVISTSIPFSILVAFSLMYLCGVKIHQVSLVALIIALGILVDDAIVVSDSIQVRLDDHEEAFPAAFHGATRCTIPNLAATLTIILAFAPLLGIPGAPGQYLYDLPWVVIVSVAASYFAAMFVVPCMMTYFAREKKTKRSDGPFRLFFQKLLILGMQHKKKTICFVFAAFVLVMALVLPALMSQFFPYVDKEVLYIQINSEKTSDLNFTEQLTAQIEKQLWTIPEITDCITSVGDGLPKFYMTMPTPMPSNDFAQILVKYDLNHSKQFKSNVELAASIQSLLNETVSGGSYEVKLLESAIPTDAKIIVRVSGENLDRLTETAGLIEQKLRHIPGAVNIRNNWNKDTLQMNIAIDEDKAGNAGVSKYDVQKEINLALYGNYASVFRQDGNEYNIKVKSDINDTTLLENFAIKSTITGNKIPLRQFADLTYSSKAGTISTYNRDPSINILADPLSGYDSSKIEDQIENTIIPELDLHGITITFAGEREDIRENFSALGVLAVVAIFLIYIVLLLMFKSFVQPLVILTTMPLSLIGSVLGLFIFRQPLSFTAFLGIISLIGLVVKNGVLLIDFINEARRNGSTIDEACIDAVGRRFNAVIISALTVILALIPLALSRSTLYTPMAISLMSGLIVATFLTMVVVPIIYSIIENVKNPL